MRLGLTLKWSALGVIAAAMLVLFAWGSGASPRAAVAGAPPALPPLLGCPNVDGSDGNGVRITDISAVVQRYHKDYPDPGYAYLFDSVQPYDFQNPMGTGKLRINDISYVVLRYHNTCTDLDTQIAKATRAIGDPGFSDILCDDVAAPLYTTSTNCGGSTQFLTEDASFLLTKGYRQGSTDVSGQGVHYINYLLWDGVFNPVRPEGLVYKNGRLLAQLYYAAGDSAATTGGSAGVGWAANPAQNKRAVDLEALPCAPVSAEPPSIGACSWPGSFDGFHWHEHLCTYGIGTTGAVALPGDIVISMFGGPIDTLAKCNTFAGSHPGFYPGPNVTCTFYPTVNFNCSYTDAAGWMGHLWNWLPNGAFTDAVNQEGLTCQTGLCSAGESNGRFADCYPEPTLDLSKGNHLNGAISATDTTININNVIGTGLAAGPGLAYIVDGTNGNEQISYTANSGTQLTGVVRVSGIAVSHASGLAIYISGNWNAYNCPQ